MSLTLEKLLKYAGDLQRQVEAASNMMHQAAGALHFVRNQIQELQNPQEEPKDEQVDKQEQEQAS